MSSKCEKYIKGAAFNIGQASDRNAVEVVLDYIVSSRFMLWSSSTGIHHGSERSAHFDGHPVMWYLVLSIVFTECAFYVKLKCSVLLYNIKHQSITYYKW